MKRPEPFFRWPALSLKDHSDVLVLGAGLGGCFVASALLERGLKVRIVDAHGAPAKETSGNPRGAYLPLATRSEDDLLGRFYGVAFDCLRKKLDTLEAAGFDLDRHETGIVHLAYNPRLMGIYDSLKAREHPHMQGIDSVLAGERLGLETPLPALYYERGGSVSPPALCQALISGMDVIKGHVRRLERRDGRWFLFDQHGAEIANAEVLVLSGAFGQMSLEQSSGLTVRTSLGQLNLVKPKRMPKAICCHHGYMIPEVEGRLLVGASWREEGAPMTLSEDEMATLVEEAMSFLPELEIEAEAQVIGRVGRRTGTPDHLPLCGPVPNLDAFLDVYKDLHHGRFDRLAEPPWWDGLYTMTALGARGLLAAPLCAEILANRLCGDTSGVDEALERAIHPARYLVRYLKRRRP